MATVSSEAGCWVSGTSLLKNSLGRLFVCCVCLACQLPHDAPMVTTTIEQERLVPVSAVGQLAGRECARSALTHRFGDVYRLGFPEGSSAFLVIVVGQGAALA